MTYDNPRELIIGTYHTYRDWGLLLVDKDTPAPEPKEYYVDIPGGNGQINLTTSLSGDTRYNNREWSFQFAVIAAPIEIELLKTEIANRIHGRELPFSLSYDEGYTYKGLFKISGWAIEDTLHQMTLEVTADPFKYKTDPIYQVNAIGGAYLMLDSGRKQVRPTFETHQLLKVVFKNQTYLLPAGTWQINNILFAHGGNEIYLSTFDVRHTTYQQLRALELDWGMLKTKRIFQWYKETGTATEIASTTIWAFLESLTFNELANKTYAEMMVHSEEADLSNITDVYITYEWGDL